MNFRILEFRTLNRNDNYNVKWKEWSRIYEYEWVLNSLKKLNINKNAFIHNSSWGFEGVHIDFKNELEKEYHNTIHTDIKISDLSNTYIYDITKKPDEMLLNKFDVVINISTIEEVGFDNISIFNNLIEQVKTNGYFIITFDLLNNDLKNSGKKNGAIYLEDIEKYLNFKLDIDNNRITGINSEIINKTYPDLSCGVLILQKL